MPGLYETGVPRLISAASSTPSPESRLQWSEHFIGDVGDTIDRPITIDVQANATADFISGAGPGVLRILSTSASEAQAGQVTWGDTLMANLSRGPIFEARVRIAPAGTAFTADERVIIGLCSAHANSEDAFDSVTTNAWFRIEGANNDVLTEVDNGTNDDDDNNTGIDWVKSTWYDVRIDCRDLAKVKFYWDGVLVNTLSLAGITADTYVQPIVCWMRDAGAEVNSIDVDFVSVRESF